ncbi:MAG: TIGR03862 family flavoprotein, partial [Proteobacteria bacterium]|nr:TIGR03862 family flavoprotein [Pseudomonadota bacterium]
MTEKPVLIVGSGPAALMAADVVSDAGIRAVIVEAMPSPGRKLLMAGRGGLNLTHGEPLEAFLDRYGDARSFLEAPVRAFPPGALRAFVEGLGQETFIGSSGRIFPKTMKASPLLRAWLARLRGRGVEMRTRCRWIGSDKAGTARIATPSGEIDEMAAAAQVLALGGASWPRLGSDGAWVPELASWGIRVAPLSSANAGAMIGWSSHVSGRFAGEPLKRIAISTGGRVVRGEAVVTQSGLEGGAIYALNPEIRAQL